MNSGTKINISGVLVTIVTTEESEAAAALIVLRKGQWSPFTDNIEGACSHCGHAVFFRPSAPKTPPRVCMECMLEMIEARVQ